MSFQSLEIAESCGSCGYRDQSHFNAGVKSYCDSGTWRTCNCICLTDEFPSCGSLGFDATCGSCAGKPCQDPSGSPAGQAWCCGYSNTESDCADGFDNDNDGQMDCCDSDCSDFCNPYKCNTGTCTCRSSCTSTDECVNACCEKEIDLTKDQCVSVGSRDQPYICVSSSPAGWVECSGENVGTTLEADGVTYTCFNENGNLKWIMSSAVEPVVITNQLMVLFVVSIAALGFVFL